MPMVQRLFEFNLNPAVEFTANSERSADFPVDFPVRSQLGGFHDSEEPCDLLLYYVAADWKVRAPNPPQLKLDRRRIGR